MHRTAVAVLWLLALCSSRLPAQAGRPTSTAPAPAPQTLAERVQQVIDRPEYRRSSFGVAFYDLDAKTPVFTLNADKLFVPGSTTKLVTEGTGVVISPVAVNDNLVDVTVAPGAAPGDRVVVTPSPVTAYVRFVNQATTAASDSQPEIRWASDSAGPDGSRTVTVTGRMPAGKPAWLFSYAVPQPSRFAEVVLVEALHARGVRVAVSPLGVRHDFTALASAYTPDNLVAEHVSPPLTEEAKVTLKVSQNLHASMMPFILGGLLAHDGSAKAGFKLEHDMLERAGLG